MTILLDMLTNATNAQLAILGILVVTFVLAISFLLQSLFAFLHDRKIHQALPDDTFLGKDIVSESSEIGFDFNAPTRKSRRKK